jgi:NitT/TauT family transport system permease protein
MLRSIPIVAIIPVVARLVGYGNKIVPIVTIMLAFFPAYVMTTSGLRSASATSRDLLQALGASRWTLLRRVLVPTAIPNLLVALRLCASSTVLAAMVAEFLAGTNGLGRLFSSTRVRFETERAWGAALIATALSVVFFQVALRIERWGRARFR